MSRSFRRNAAVTAVLLCSLAPMEWSGSGSLKAAQACADGTCCTEEGSICIINNVETKNAYYKGTGSCKEPTKPLPDP